MKEKIKINELRIGNYLTRTERRQDLLIVKEISEEDFQISVFDGDIMDYGQPDEKWMSPIPLDDYWLSKFSLKTSINDRLMYVLKDTGIAIYIVIINEDYVLNISTGCGVASIEVEFVHDLQNLYFALTNEELRLEE